MTKPRIGKHGTYTSYQAKCKCEPCMEAGRRYRKRLALRLQRGQRAFVDEATAARVRGHIATLGAAGVGQRQVATVTGLARCQVFRIVGGGGMRPATAAKILAVSVDDASDRARTVAFPTLRRLRALIAAGFSVTTLARLLGVNSSTLDYTMRMERVTVGMARRVRELYGDGTLELPPQRPEATKAARRRAAARGWVPPHCWHPDDLDDPDGEPLRSDIEPGKFDLAEVEHLAAGGVSEYEIARRLGVRVDTLRGKVSRARRRAEVAAELAAAVDGTAEQDVRAS